MSGESSSIPAWLQLFLATLTGGVIAAGTLVKIAFGFNSRLQQVEGLKLDQLIIEHLEKERHDRLYPMLADRVFKPMDKLEDEVKVAVDKLRDEVHLMSKDVTALLERDRIGQRLEKIISALNQQALKPEKD